MIFLRQYFRKGELYKVGAPVPTELPKELKDKLTKRGYIGKKPEEPAKTEKPEKPEEPKK